MDEADYWARLEYRVSREFAGMAERRLRSLWCDGFIPQQYLISEPNPRIVGRAWIGDGPAQHEWEFTLFLPRAARLRDEIEWGALLPAEDVTRWLAADLAARRIQIEPRRSDRAERQDDLPEDYNSETPFTSGQEALDDEPRPGSRDPESSEIRNVQRPPA